MINEVYEKARKFIYRNARPLDLALWKYHFEGGGKKDVIDVLAFYQNADGGFGHGIEPDFLNPNSTPIATWRAIGIFNEIDASADEKIVKDILRYLDSGKDFQDGKWYNTVKTNNDYPHAVWWECDSEIGIPNDNPTISLAGFAIKHADKNSALYKKAKKIAVNAAKTLTVSTELEMHTARLYIELYEYCSTIEGFDLFDLGLFKSALYSAIKNIVCTDSSKWFTEYVCKPSFYYDGYKLVFDILGMDLCRKEGELMLNNRLPDGSFPVTWLWHNDYKEYYVAENWWKSNILINNLLYLRDLKFI